MICPNCKSEIDYGSTTCSNCGTVVASSSDLNVGQFIWSIINTLCCCMPLGIISMIFTFMARNACTADEERGKLKTAKTINVIATIIGIMLIAIYAISIIVLQKSGAFEQYS